MSSAIISHLDDTEQLVSEVSINEPQLRATMQAQPEATLRPTTTESLTITPEAADRAIADAEMVASTPSTDTTVTDVETSSTEPAAEPFALSGSRYRCRHRRRRRANDARECATSPRARLRTTDAPPSFDASDAARRETETPTKG